METVCFPESLDELRDLLRESPYLDNLCLYRAEQEIKNGSAFENVEELINHYASSSQLATEDDKKVIRNVVCFLYKTYPQLPVVSSIYFVIVSPDKKPIEFGNTSFTINNVVFLNSLILQNVGDGPEEPEVIMHEVIHVIQRCEPVWFDGCCQRLGFNQNDVGMSDIASISKCEIISNPDADTLYVHETDGEKINVYSSDIKPRMVNIRTGQCEPAVLSTMAFLGAKMKKDSVSEMFAVRLTKKDYITDDKLVKKVNTLLKQVEYRESNTGLATILVGFLVFLMMK